MTTEQCTCLEHAGDSDTCPVHNAPKCPVCDGRGRLGDDIPCDACKTTGRAQ